MSDADKKNNFMFRNVCCEVLQNSYSKFKLQNDLNLGVKLLTHEIIFAFKKNKNRNKVTRAKSLQKNTGNKILTYSDLNKTCRFLKTSKFTSVIKLLKFQYNYGVNKAIFSVLE